MGAQTLNEFVSQTAERLERASLFELEGERILELNLNGRVWTKMGSMIAYTGAIKFTREGMLEHGLGKFLKKTLTGEGIRLTKAEGTGRLYLADAGKKITVLDLGGQSLFVNGNAGLHGDGRGVIGGQ